MNSRSIVRFSLAAGLNTSRTTAQPSATGGGFGSRCRG